MSACHVGRVVGTILTWLVSPFVLGGAAVILGFLLLVTQGQRAHFRRDREKLRTEFEAYRRQMQAKVGLCFWHALTDPLSAKNSGQSQRQTVDRCRPRHPGSQ